MKTIQNASAALLLISESPDPISVAKIATHLGVPRSSASRLMTSLRSGGLVEQDPGTRLYGPGLLAWQLGTRYHPAGYAMDLLSDSMSALSQLTGFTCWISILDRQEIVLLRHHQGRTPALFSLRLGQRLPAHATAAGKALLARLPGSAVEKLFEDRLMHETPQTITSRSMLMAEVERARKRGYALARQEAFPGVVAVGGAVYGAACNNPLGLSLSFPMKSGDADHVATQLTTTLRQIGQQLGDPFWLRQS